MISVRTTTIESFRLMMTTDWMTEAEMTARVQGRGEENWKMQAGTAFHAIIESPARHQQTVYDDDGDPVQVYQSNGWTFDAPGTEAALQHIGWGIHEVQGSRIFQVSGRPVLVTGKADMLSGLSIQDHKCKWGTTDARDYEDSLQWRLYLLIHGGAWLRYNLLGFSDPDEERRCTLRDITSVRFWPYCGMQSDCLEWLVQFLEWAGDRNLLENLARAA